METAGRLRENSSVAMSAINYSRAGVVVVDVQAGLFCSQPPPWKADLVVERINQVVARGRSAGRPVVFVQHDGTAGENLVPLTDGWKLHAGLQVAPDDLVLRKTTCDAFYRTSLEAELRSRDINTIVLMGYATEFCIDSTLRNAMSKDFAVVVVADAHTTNDSPMLQAELIWQHLNWAWANCASSAGVFVLNSEAVRF
jgi:nicotinamidase-related amidase